jgi:Mg-chelatase subunit ChlD
MLLAAPDATIAPSEIAAKDVVFVFDTSGSMAGEK